MLLTHQKHLFTASIAASVLFIVSCGDNFKPKPVEKNPFSVASYLAKDTIGFFRGAEFGDENEVIRQMENDSFLVFNSPNLLQYEYKLAGERRYKMDYTFKKNKLAKFSFDIYLANTSEADNVTTAFIDWFTKKYGKEITQMGVHVWPIKTDGYKEAYIELKDESAEFGYGKVNISAYAIK